MCLADRWPRTMAVYVGLFKNDVVGHESYEIQYKLDNRPQWIYINVIYPKNWTDNNSTGITKL